MQRMGWVVPVRAEFVARYRDLHRAVPAQVLAMISACNIRNYTIFLREPENLLFAVYDYVGTDHAADMARMAADPATQAWWDLTKPCHDPLPSRAEGEWWAGMEPVFHLD